MFREFGLSPFIDEPRPLVGTSLYRFLRGLLDLKVHDWSLPAITACLRSDFCRITRDEADRLENFLLARGLTGAGRVFDNRRYRAEFQSLTVMPSDDEEAEEEPEELRVGRDDRRAAEASAAREARALRSRVLEPLRDFLDTLGSEPSCAGKCRLLAGFLETYGVREAVGQRSDELHAAGEDEAAITLVRAWNGIARVLDQMTTIAGDGRYGMEEFRDALAAGMEGAQSGAIPPVIDRLTVSGFERAGFRRARVLFLLGANEDAFPGSVPPEGLLKDPDRERISAQLGVRLPSVLRDQVFSDAALAYALLTSPSDALYLSAPVGSRPASGYVDLLRRVVPEGRHRTVGLADADDPRTGAVRPARRFLLSSAADETLPGDPGRMTVLRALADTLGFPAQESQGGRWRSWLEEDRVTARLPAALVRQAVGEHARMSVSQLERFAACPYAYFSQYLLRLQDRDVWSPQATDTGSLLHGILELAVRGLAEELETAATEEERQAVLIRWQGLDYDRFADRCMREIAERDGYGLFFDAGIHASGGRRVLRLGSASLRAAVAQLSTDGAVPICTEWRFGSGDTQALALHVQGVTVGFRGVIDRVDCINSASDPVIDRVDRIDPTGICDFRIVDYKSGDVRFDPDKVFYGLSLQLPAYAAAYRNTHPGARPVEMAYFRFQTPVATYAAHEGCRDEADARDRIARQFKLQKTGLEPAEIAEVTGHTLGRMDALCGALLSGKADARPARIGSSPPACRYCDCRAICGHEGKAFFHMKPLAELVPKEVEKNRMRKMIRAIRQTAPEEE